MKYILYKFKIIEGEFDWWESYYIMVEYGCF